MRRPTAAESFLDTTVGAANREIIRRELAERAAARTVVQAAPAPEPPAPKPPEDSGEMPIELIDPARAEQERVLA